MPYIQRNTREQLDQDIDDFISNIKNRFEKRNFYELGGIANYIITRILLNFLKCGNKWSYTKLSQVIGTLECAKLEITRRLLNNYEDTKIQENGDLKEFAE